MNNRTWQTRCWVDGKATVHIVAWSSKEEAIEQCKIAMAGTPFVAARDVVRLEVVGTERFSSGETNEFLSDRWSGNSEGTFDHMIVDGTHMLPSSMPPVEIQ
jgi:hypothetical protein